MVRTKVFVGNLSFKTRETELAQEFGAVAKVVGANIITRGPRSLGYGFVELESEEDANKAVQAMDKKEIDGRQINVEVAKDRVEGEKKPKQPRAPKPKKEGAAEGAATPTTTPAAAGSATPTEGAARGGKKGGKRGGARGARGGAKEGGAPKETKPKTPKAPAKEGEATGSPAQPKAPRVKRERTPRDDSNRTPSQTVLFVANIPFSYTDESFAKLFTDAGFKPKKAHVVVKKNAKSKGFGFVEFETHEDQQKALTQFAEKKVEERALNVKVALEEPTPAEGSVAANPTSTPTAAAASSPKPAAATPTTPKA